jgi:hypothetical protein
MLLVDHLDVDRKQFENAPALLSGQLFNARTNAPCVVEHRFFLLRRELRLRNFRLEPCHICLQLTALLQQPIFVGLEIVRRETAVEQFVEQVVDLPLHIRQRLLGRSEALSPSL